MIKTVALEKIFRTEEVETLALNKVSIEVKEGEFVAIMGPSGCGKSTLLNILGLLDNPTSGEYYLNGIEVSRYTEAQRTKLRKGIIGFVFQSFNLIDELNVYENIELPLLYMGVSAAERKKKVQEAMERMAIVHREKHFPQQLSGGQQQRVAIARAVVNRPSVLLLDEPLGALDLQLRRQMQLELKALQKQLGITFIYITHDQEEALTMSDTVVVMNGGKVQQIGTPEDIYNEPKNAFVADFIGESNIIDGVMVRDKVVKMYGREFPCVDGGFAPNEPVDVVIRPEDVDIVPEGQGQLKGTVTSVTFKGMQYDIIVDFYGFKWLIQTTDLSPVGSRIGIKIDPDGIHVMKKSHYSGMFGDYSSYSEEYEEISDADYDPEAEDQEAEHEEE